MKITLDTTNKTVKVEGTVNLKELMDDLKKLLPDDQWSEYSLIGTTTEYIYTSYPVYPSYPVYATYVSIPPYPTTPIYTAITP